MQRKFCSLMKKPRLFLTVLGPGLYNFQINILMRPNNWQGVPGSVTVPLTCIDIKKTCKKRASLARSVFSCYNFVNLCNVEKRHIYIIISAVWCKFFTPVNILVTCTVLTFVVSLEFCGSFIGPL